MRIMQLNSGMLVNGAVLQCLALTRALAARGHEMSLVCRPGSWIGEQLAGSDVEVIHSSLRRWPLADARQLADLARDHGVEILHSHQSRAHAFGLLVRWRSGIPAVATAHARHIQPHWCLNDFVIANSRATYEFQNLWNLVPRRRMRVVHYLLDLDRLTSSGPEMRESLRRSWNCDARQLVVGVIGDIIPRKGQLDVVRAWPRIVRSVPAARLVFVGSEKVPAYAARVRATIERLGIGESVLFAGFHQDVAPVMNALDLCVSAAVEEALGLTVPEAMAAGKAVVATEVGGVPENIWHGETGLLVPPACPAALAEAIIEILSDDARRIEFGRLGLNRVREKYDPARQVREVETIYEWVAARRRVSRRRIQSVTLPRRNSG
jgi:glycosyltransferase involved in cell wall biosynthesis